jgi:hypothetical protein
VLGLSILALGYLLVINFIKKPDPPKVKAEDEPTLVII